MRVLQVEDDPAAAQAVEQMMGARGYACQTTAYGAEAVALAVENDYDLILLDIMLPDIDGYEVLRQLQAAGIHVPVLIQSGMIDRDELEKGVSFGVENYLVKPFSRNELDERIDAVMARVDQMAPTTPAHPDNYDRRNDFRDDGEIRRSHARMLTLKGGQIIYNNANCVADCLILNLSNGGAALQATDAITLPTLITLKDKRGKSYQCEICWQHGKKLGVRFI